MAFVVLRRVSLLRSTSSSLLSSQCSKFSTSKFVGQDRGNCATNRLHLSPLFSETGNDGMKDCKIELVDDATWRVSSSLADAWRGNNGAKMRSDFIDQECDGVGSHVDSNKHDPDFDEIEDMRIRGKLFYKLDKDSKEYDEYKFDFHRRKAAKNEKDRKGSKEKSKKKENLDHIVPSAKNKDTVSHETGDLFVEKKKLDKDSKEYEECKFDSAKNERDQQRSKEKSKKANLDYTEDMVSHEMGDLFVEKKKRTLTFNQQTAPYHEPFCLDIFISKGSVRASIIHRATSNVVVVSHSISKDMKFDLGSTKNRSACAAVGKALAQRALDDDIHNAVYTPRRGEKLEGKLKVVLDSIVDGGVDVKVKLKQKKTRRLSTRS